MMHHAEGAGILEEEEEGEGEGEGEEEDAEANACWYNKDALVRAHERFLAVLEKNLSPQTSTVATSTWVTMGATEATGAPSVPLRGLRPLLVKHLQFCCHHKGQVLYGELCVEPLKMVAVQTILVDEEGHGVRLSVYNALPHQHTAQKMRALFPKGLKVAIKEPYFKIAMDETLMIRVDNPANFIRNPTVQGGSGGKNICTSSLSSSSSSSCSSSSVSASPADQPRLLVDARDLRNQGNEAFAAQDWNEAIRLYTNAVKILLPRRHTSPLLPLSSSSSSLSPSRGVSKELLFGFSNRAEARLRLKHFEAAESDAQIALQLQKDHVKTLSRRGRALHGLHQYKEAALCFKGAIQLTGDGDGVSTMELTSLLHASEICDKLPYEVFCLFHRGTHCRNWVTRSSFSWSIQLLEDIEPLCQFHQKLRNRRIIRVPAVSAKRADIPPDEFSLRKYGQKPIKGSPHPRGYYKCSSVRGCPARKHVERAFDDPSMLIVTHEEEHSHGQVPSDNVAGMAGMPGQCK